VDLDLERPLRLLVLDHDGSATGQCTIFAGAQSSEAVRHPGTTLWVNGDRVAIVTGVGRPLWLRLEGEYCLGAPGVPIPGSDEPPPAADRGPRRGPPRFPEPILPIAPIGASPSQEVWLARMGESITVMTFRYGE